jgi:hypothetical protein
MDFTKKYNSEVIEADDGSGDAILQFPDEMIECLGWKEGDTLSISAENDVIILKKKDV